MFIVPTSPRLARDARTAFPGVAGGESGRGRGRRRRGQPRATCFCTQHILGRPRATGRLAHLSNDVI